ncbi:MAG: hypothetical protein ACJAXL_001091 [Alphaproteobacteria bacterium]
MLPPEKLPPAKRPRVGAVPSSSSVAFKTPIVILKDKTVYQDARSKASASKLRQSIIIINPNDINAYVDDLIFHVDL